MVRKNRGAWDDYEHYRQTAVNQKRGGMYSPWINILAGGPVGWAKQASGEGGLGGTFGERRADIGLTEEDFYLMSDDEHNQYENMNQNQRANFLARIREERAAEGAENAKRMKAEKDLEDKRIAREGAQDDLIAKVRAFADQMNMPIDQLMAKDEFAQALNKQTYQNTMGQALNTGAGMGGLSQVNADQATKNALLGYQMQRQQMGQQAMGQAYGMVNNQMLQAEDIARYNQGMNLQMQEAEAMRRQQEYMQGLGQAQGKAGMIGGIMGGIWGGPTGAAMGQQIGSSMGGQRYQSNNPYKSYKFAYPSSTRPSGGSGGLGGVGYGGNY